MEEVKTQEEQTKTEDVNAVANEALVQMLSQIFSKEKIEEFLNTLNDEQNRYLSAFITGFRAHLRFATGKDDADIVGVFDHEYVAEKNLPKEILNFIGLRYFEVNVPPLNLNFDIYWQEIPNTETLPDDACENEG